MGLELLGVQNLSYKNDDNSTNYLLSGDDSRVSNVNIPNTIPEFGYITPSQLIDFTATDALADRLSSRYNKDEINTLLDKIRIMIRGMIQDMKDKYRRRR